MELRQLQYLVAVVEEASFTRAANRVHVAQPGVSAQVRRLERELGQELLDRSGRTVRTTAAGDAVLPFARAALAAVDGARSAVDELTGLVRGRVTVGTVVGCGAVGLPEVLAAFHRAHPGVEIALTEGGSDRLVAGLLDGDLDLGLIGLAGAPEPGLAVQVVVDEPLVVGVGRDDPWWGRDGVPIGELRERTLVSLPVGTGLRGALDAACSAAGFTPRIALESGDLGVVADFAAGGLGAAVLAASVATARPDLHGVAIEPAVRSSLALAWRSDGPSSPAGGPWWRIPAPPSLPRPTPSTTDRVGARAPGTVSVNVHGIRVRAIWGAMTRVCRGIVGPGRVPAGLLALALGSFGIGLAEFVIAALLPQIASSLDVSVPAAGWLISGYALTVTVGAIVVTAVTAHLDRKHVLLGLVGLFVTGNLLCAVAPTYSAMFVGRVISALCHGSFFGIGSLVARDLAETEKGSRAVAVMFGGLTLANVMGVPFGALIGQQWGWRATFWALTVIGGLAVVGILVLIPRQSLRIKHSVETQQSPPAAAVGHSLRTQLRALCSSQVWLTLAATALSYGGMFGAFSYIAYTFTQVGGFSAPDISWLLIVYGSGLVIGNLTGGRAADHNRDGTLLLALTGLAVTLALFGLLASSRTASVILVFLMGIFGFASVPGFITRVTDYAQGAALAASANVSASNIGIALGAWLGGLAISAGYGYTAPLFIGAVVVLASLVVMAVTTVQAKNANISHRRFGLTRE